MFRLMKNWNISLIVEYMKILGKSTCFAIDIQVVWKESSDAFVGRSFFADVWLLVEFDWAFNNAEESSVHPL